MMFTFIFHIFNGFFHCFFKIFYFIFRFYRANFFFLWLYFLHLVMGNIVKVVTIHIHIRASLIIPPMASITKRHNVQYLILYKLLEKAIVFFSYTKKNKHKAPITLNFEEARKKYV
ncbi:hypothetical protein WN66_01598 [Saccharomyces cerevisiae]|nr:hypothetical protein WN66_01598 [Saccharomyces cerevisiae]